MAKRTQLIGRSPRMEQVINLVSRPEFMRILESAYEPERNTFTDRHGNYGGGSSGNPGYTGYFKVVNASEYDEEGKLTAAKVRIVNGAASEPDQEHDAGFISAYGKNYAVKAKTLDVDGGAAADSLVYLRFVNADSEDEATEFVCSKTPLQDDGLNDLLLLARVAKEVKDIQQNEFPNDAVKIGSEYRGAFAIAPAGAGRWRIAAGETDLGAVPEKLVELTSGSIFLIAQYSTDYTLTISTAKPDSDFGFFVLASVKNNVVTEVWNSGTAYFGERYWI